MERNRIMEVEEMEATEYPDIPLSGLKRWDIKRAIMYIVVFFRKW